MVDICSGGGGGGKDNKKPQASKLVFSDKGVYSGGFWVCLHHPHLIILVAVEWLVGQEK